MIRKFRAKKNAENFPITPLSSLLYSTVPHNPQKLTEKKFITMVLWYGTIHKKITSELYVTLGVTKKKTAKIDMTALIREKKNAENFPIRPL